MSETTQQAASQTSTPAPTWAPWAPWAEIRLELLALGFLEDAGPEPGRSIDLALHEGCCLCNTCWQRTELRTFYHPASGVYLPWRVCSALHWEAV